MNKNTMRQTEPVIEVIRLVKTFKDFWHREKIKAVDGLSLKIYPGEVYGLLGPNGSGKTTTLKIMLGLLFPTSGLVRIFGKSPRNVVVKSRIGFLPEESYFYKHLSAKETMNFYGALFEIPSEERGKRGNNLLEMLGLLSSQTRPVGEYSKGMMRRIGLAQALVNDPDLVILDEPTSGLDPVGRREVKNLILKLKQLGKTVLLSSHLLSEVQDVCDRICILYGGRKITEGRVDEVLVKKNTAQLSFSADREESVEKIREFAARTLGNGQVGVSHPFETLEEFFLREIEKLEPKKKKAPLAPEGAVEVSVLERLTAAEPPQPSGQKPEEKTPVPEEEEKKRRGLRELVQEQEETDRTETEQKRKAVEEKEARKKGVFDRLLEDKD